MNHTWLHWLGEKVGYAGPSTVTNRDIGHIRFQCWLSFWVRFALILVVAFSFGWARIKNYEHTLTSEDRRILQSESDKKYIIQFQAMIQESGRKTIEKLDIDPNKLGDRENILVISTFDRAIDKLFDKCKIALTVFGLSLIWFFFTWFRLTEYIISTRWKSDENGTRTRVARKDRFTDEQFEKLQGIFEPPGDIFTMIGVGFTFFALSLGLLNLPSDLYSTMVGVANSNDIASGAGPSIAEATAEFGTSLSIGLLASLFGVLLALGARKLQACHSASVHSPISDADHTKDMLSVMKDIKSCSIELKNEITSMNSSIVLQSEKSSEDLATHLRAINISISSLKNTMSRAPYTRK